MRPVEYTYAHLLLGDSTSTNCAIASHGLLEAASGKTPTGRRPPSDAPSEDPRVRLYGHQSVRGTRCRCHWRRCPSAPCCLQAASHRFRCRTESSCCQLRSLSPQTPGGLEPVVEGIVVVNDSHGQQLFRARVSASRWPCFMVSVSPVSCSESPITTDPQQNRRHHRTPMQAALDISPLLFHGPQPVVS